MSRRLLIAAVLGLLALSPAWAIEKGQWEIAIGPDFHFFDNGMGADNTLAGRLRLGWNFAGKAEVEVAVQYAKTVDDFGGATDVGVTYETAAVNLVWAIGAQDFQPFVLLGLGLADLDLDSRNECSSSDATGCLPRKFGDIRVNDLTDGKQTGQLDDQGLLWQAGLGVRWPLGKHVGFRVQATAARIDVFEKGLTNLSAGVDVSILWGQPK